MCDTFSRSSRTPTNLPSSRWTFVLLIPTNQTVPRCGSACPGLPACRWFVNSWWWCGFLPCCGLPCHTPPHQPAPHYPIPVTTLGVVLGPGLPICGDRGLWFQFHYRGMVNVARAVTLLWGSRLRLYPRLPTPLLCHTFHLPTWVGPHSHLPATTPYTHYLPHCPLPRTPHPGLTVGFATPTRTAPYRWPPTHTHPPLPTVSRMCQLHFVLQRPTYLIVVTISQPGSTTK